MTEVLDPVAICDRARQIRLEHAHHMLKWTTIDGWKALQMVVWPEPALEAASIQAAVMSLLDGDGELDLDLAA